MDDTLSNDTVRAMAGELIGKLAKKAVVKNVKPILAFVNPETYARYCTICEKDDICFYGGINEMINGVRGPFLVYTDGRIDHDIVHFFVDGGGTIDINVHDLPATFIKIGI